VAEENAEFLERVTRFARSRPLSISGVRRPIVLQAIHWNREEEAERSGAVARGLRISVAPR
jgi:hypothetical protein